MNTKSLSGRRLSALIVNHNSGAWTQRCVESLQRAWDAEGGAADDLEVIVLDSGSATAESTWWRTLRRAGARVRSSPANVGYATGLNMAYELSSGQGQDTVALLNPDLHFRPGSIGPLIQHLQDHPETGAVGPRIFLDEEQEILLPPNELPRPGREFLEACAARFPAVARWRARRQSRAAHEFWGQSQPMEREMLSGACLFLRRETIERLGQVMDGRFPLYFEDADLCRELRGLDYRLMLEPTSEILHHWSRCAGPEFTGEVASRHAYSRSLYMAKHHPGVLATMIQGGTRLLGTWGAGREPACMHPVVDLGEVHECPQLNWTGTAQAWMEISLTPFWGLCAGTPVEGGSFQYSAKAWSWLFPGTYYLRCIEQESGQLLGAWKFHKSSPARSWPLDVGATRGPNRTTWRRPSPGERVG